MIYKTLALIILFSLGSLTAQTIFPQKSTLLQNPKSLSTTQTINILAVMVEFQADKYDLTKGNGKFGTIYTQDYGSNIIDPLPHDKSYFEDHLEFAKNYYRKSSNGIVELSYNVLPEIVTVPKFMRDYSPVETNSFKILGDFSSEVWNLASSENPSVDFSQYDLFVIFHAGVGNDISTSNLLGEPRDLPSLYLSFKSLKQFYGESFTGFELSNGAKITNSLILPETESREESGFGGTVLIELSINGLIVSNIASHLGLPDLFDAETGKSAIGRFGLMDGQSLFAFGGLFPPEPSAWEKIFLGWEEPVVINSNSTNINVDAKVIAGESSAKIIKVPINSSEYYLIENRQRDANKDGAVITYKVDGTIKQTAFNNDIDNFNNAVIDSINGVVLDVDEFDWATPGRGILIWHIDEKIINQGLESNKINIGKNRGVDLEEADGIQDIGQEFSTIFGDIIIAEGDEFDYWYSSNPSELFKNRFGIDTKPNTETNTGANSLISFSNFSDVSNNMSFDVSFQNNEIQLLYQNKLNIEQVFNGIISINTLPLVNENRVFVNHYSNLYQIDSLGNIKNQFEEFSWYKPAVVTFSNEGFIIGVFDQNNILGDILNIYDSSNDSVISVNLKKSITSTPIVQKIDNENFNVILGTHQSDFQNILTYQVNIRNIENLTLIDSVRIANIGAIKQLAINGEDYIATGLLSLHR